MDCPGTDRTVSSPGVAYDSIPERWFSPIVGAGARPAMKFRLAQAGILGVANLTGTRLPWPESVRLDQAHVVARWAVAHGPCPSR